MKRKQDPQGSPADRFKKNVGSILQQKRMEKRFSIEGIASETKHSKSTVSDMENGIHNFTINFIAEYADYFGISLYELFTPPPKK